MSQSTEQWSFHVDQQNSVPSVPELHLVRGDSFIALKALDAPTDETAPISQPQPTFRAGGSSDLEMDAISYVFSITDLDGMGVVDEMTTAAQMDNVIQWTSPVELQEDAYFQVSVYAIDDRGGESDVTAGIVQVWGRTSRLHRPCT